MQFLYQHDFTGAGKDEDIALFLKDQELDDDSYEFCRMLIAGALSKNDELDTLLGKYVDNWGIKRIASVDRNVIRMALYEMLYLKDIPAIVSINEAVDIAKKYSTAESGKFVNGVLDKIKQEIVDKQNGKKSS